MIEANLDYASEAYADARDKIAGAVLAIAELKNVCLESDQHVAIAEIVARRSDPDELAVLASAPSPVGLPTIMEEIVARLEELAALQVILTFARVGKIAPMPDDELLAFARELADGLGRRPDDPGSRWPSLAEWEQIAAGRFGVAAPADRAAFGAMVTSYAGRA